MRVGFISTRLNGTDGVSLEVEKWAKVLTRIGHEIYYCAGELGGVTPALNPHSEQTLKANSENNYCRAQQSELVRFVYQPELDEYWKWVEGRLKSSSKQPWTRPASFNEARKAIQDRFYDTPLADMAPTETPRSAARLIEILDRVEDLVRKQRQS